jgi:hypothetical protein
MIGGPAFDEEQFQLGVVIDGLGSGHCGMVCKSIFDACALGII